MKTLLIFASMTVVLMSSGNFASAQKKTSPENLDLQTTNFKEGKMFTVTLRPSAKNIEVDIVGKRLAELEENSLGLTADLYLGNRVIRLSPKKLGRTFSMDLPKQPGKGESLLLKVNSGKAIEEFKFDLRTP